MFNLYLIIFILIVMIMSGHIARLIPNSKTGVLGVIRKIMRVVSATFKDFQ